MTVSMLFFMFHTKSEMSVQNKFAAYKMIVRQIMLDAASI